MTEQPSEVLPEVEPHEAEACIAALVESRTRNQEASIALESARAAEKFFAEIHGPIYEKMRSRGDTEIFVIFDGKLFRITSTGAEPLSAHVVRDVPF